MQETQQMWVQSLDWEDPLEKETATHSSIPAQESHGHAAWWATVQRVVKSHTRLSN